MANNTSLPNLCDMPLLFWSTRDYLYVVAYYVLPPIQFFAGLFGHTLSYAAFRKEARKNTGYSYQALVTAADGGKILIQSLFFVTFRWWSGFTNEGVVWFTSNYYLMWYAAHLAAPFSNCTQVIVTLTTVAMAADRFYAVGRPYEYSKGDHKKYFLFSIIFSLVVGFATSIFDCFRYFLIFDGLVYKLEIDTEYMNRLSTISLLHLRNAVQGLGVLALIVLNAAAVRCFTKLSMQQVGVMNDKRQADRKKAEKTLLFLSVSQCVWMIISRIFNVGYYAVVFFRPAFLQCGAFIAGPLMESTSQICTVANFFVALCISKPFRLLILKQLPKMPFGKRRESNNEQLSTPP